MSMMSLWVFHAASQKPYGTLVHYGPALLCILVCCTRVHVGIYTHKDDPGFFGLLSPWVGIGSLYVSMLWGLLSFGRPRWLWFLPSISISGWPLALGCLGVYVGMVTCRLTCYILIECIIATDYIPIFRSLGSKPFEKSETVLRRIGIATNCSSYPISSARLYPVRVSLP